MLGRHVRASMGGIGIREGGEVEIMFLKWLISPYESKIVVIMVFVIVLVIVIVSVVVVIITEIVNVIPFVVVVVYVAVVFDVVITRIRLGLLRRSWWCSTNRIRPLNCGSNTRRLSNGATTRC